MIEGTASSHRHLAGEVGLAEEDVDLK